MVKIDFDRMNEVLEKFSKIKVLVLGDVMLDKYIWGNVARISPEAPVPVVEVNKDTSCLGGAGNVYYNIKKLGASPLLLGTVGDDTEGMWIRKNIQDNRGIFVEKGRPTTVKTRIIAHHQQVVRVDREETKPISSQARSQILSFIQDEKYDGILISDYNKGTVTKSLMKSVLDFTQTKQISVFADPKVDNFRLFSPVTLLAPNHFEAERVVQHPCLSDEQVEDAGKEILSRISTRYLILKRGEQGMTVFERGRKSFHIPTLAKEVYDVTGAGDTVISTAVLALLSGASIREAAILANTAAGIVVGKIGTATVTMSELHKVLRSFPIV